MTDDIVTRILDVATEHALRRTHYEGCAGSHLECAAIMAADEIKLLRDDVDESIAALLRAVMALMCKVDDIVRLLVDIEQLSALGDEIARLYSDLGPWANEFKSAVRAWQEARRG
jgi:hypothetical protein